MTMSTSSLHEIELNHLSLSHRGKVRDIFDIDDVSMLIVTSDRLSAFDVILPDPIPDKGKVLTTISNFWFKRLSPIIENHLLDRPLSDLPLEKDEYTQLDGRSIIVKKLKPLPIEAIVRGYLIGSGWKDYQQSGAVCGIKIPQGLSMAGRLEAPIFTPSSKADVGDHDININFEKMERLLGKALAHQVKDVSLKLYTEAAAFALEKGIIIADTKFEFGLDDNDNLLLMDEILTPDSSRFWDANCYQEGISPSSFDKQFIRDYLETLDWDKKSPSPNLPVAILQKTADKYKEVINRLMG